MNYINTHNIILRIFAIKGFSTFFVRIMGRVTWRTGPKLRSMAWNLKLGSNWTGRRGEDTAIRSRWCAHGMWCILHMSGVNLSSWLILFSTSSCYIPCLYITQSLIVFTLLTWIVKTLQWYSGFCAGRNHHKFSWGERPLPNQSCRQSCQYQAGWTETARSVWEG
jgi:hypothetical protein